MLAAREQHFVVGMDGGIPGLRQACDGIRIGVAGEAREPDAIGKYDGAAGVE